VRRLRDNRPEREKIGAAAEVGGAELLANTSMDVAIFDLVAAARRTVTGEGLAEGEELGSNVLHVGRRGGAKYSVRSQRRADEALTRSDQATDVTVECHRPFRRGLSRTTLSEVALLRIVRILIFNSSSINGFLTMKTSPTSESSG
jgi:hypothetical protein